MIYPSIEAASPEAIKTFQEEKLRTLMGYLDAHSTFYQKRFREAGMKASEIRTLEDLRKLPVTTKDDLHKYNDEFICVPREKIVDYITTSGTLGDPVTFTMTQQDLDRLAYNEYISFLCADGSPTDIYQLMVTLDRRFMAGLAYFLGLKKMGAGVIRVGNGIPELQWDTIQRFNPNWVVVVPSFLLKLIEYAEAHGIDYKNSSVKNAMCIGEALRTPDFEYNTLAQRILEKWDIKLYSTYASTEMGAAFTECGAGRGGHQHPDLLITEFLDENQQPVPEGEPGELVITTLGVEGMPLLRFATGDVVEHHNGLCSCGRNTVRLGPVIGRKKEMIKFKGTTLYPPALYDILNEVEQIENYVVEVSTNAIGTDDILIKAGVKGEPTEKLEKQIKDHFRAKLRVAPSLEFMTIAEINQIKFPETKRKPVLFIDKRE